MEKIKNNIESDLNLIKCDCGYYNRKVNIKKYGTCTICGKVLDKKAYYKHKMIIKIGLKNKKNFKLIK